VTWALEAAERFGRLSCSECTPALKLKRGCGRERSGIVGETVFRSTSPQLLVNGKPGELRECPVGRVLREAPYVYKALGAQACVENGSLNPLTAPTWLQEAMRVVAAERARLRELATPDRTGEADAAHARRVVGRG
jgi:hypothetical protein